METTEVFDKMAVFLKEAFCIDGEVTEEKRGIDVTLLSFVMYRLTDSKRGIFFVTISK